MKFMVPSEIPIALGIKATWLAIDAGLRDPQSCRVGVCLVYDFRDIGFKNVMLNPINVKHGIVGVCICHPSFVSRIVFVDAPWYFRRIFENMLHLVPARMRDA